MKKLIYDRILQVILIVAVLLSGCRKEDETGAETDLSVTKTVDSANPEVGSSVIFSITATNNGPGTATGVVVNFILPSGYTLISATITRGTWISPNWIVGSLANDGTATLTVVAQVNATGVYANKATIAGSEIDPTPGNNSTNQPTVANEVNTFVWYGLATYYLWNNLVPNLSATKFPDEESLNVFLNKYIDPQELFTDLLYKYEEVDKWSFLVDDAKTIDDWISGTSKTMGFDFMLGRINGSDNLFGFVRYVIKGSPAEAAGIKRGDIFVNINDLPLTISNYETLLFDTETYKLGFATIIDNSVSPSNRSVTMTAIELQENPINKDTTFIFNNQKIGYLVYNGFNSDFDIQLNDVIKKFKNENINQLVLDLRYNGGGSVQSSIYLASMIYGTDQSKVFAKAQYNTELQNYFIDEYGAAYLNDNFVNAIAATETNIATPITSLNLQKIYFIVSDNTASASELLINGLRPYMEVKVIGTNTYGKYVGSMTVKDWDENGDVNPTHKWAMQPIVVKYGNSDGVSDFVNGLTPNIWAEEDFANLLPFGDPNEKLLSVVLADMSGAVVTSKTLKSAQIGLKKVADSHQFKPYSNDMYINPIKKHHSTSQE